MSNKVLITMRLPQLQNLIKRDPRAYLEDFIQQQQHFLNELDILRLRPANNSDRFCELLSFISHVASCYPEQSNTSQIPHILLQLMESHGATLHNDTRAKLFQALITLRNKSMIDPVLMLKLCFQLFTINDKTLRISLSQYILNDIKNINIKKNNDKTNKAIQALLFQVVTNDTCVLTAMKSVAILGELYRRRIWTDERTVNVIATACKSKSAKVCMSAINFFLGIEIQMMEDDDEENKSTQKIEVDHHEHSKKTKKRVRQVKKQMDHISKLQRAKQAKLAYSTPLFPAIMLLHNPQELVELLYTKLRQSGERFEFKLLIMNFKYLTSHQIEVTKILAYLIQSCHDQVPPEELVPVLKTIAYNFITERCSNEVLAVGINSVREVLARVPALLLEPEMGDFIQDLAEYGHKTHKTVMVAAHSVVNLVRETHPSLLRKSDRGRGYDPTLLPSVYGTSGVTDRVAGTELLEAYERGEMRLSDEEEEGEGGDDWEDASQEEEEEEEEGAPQLVDYVGENEEEEEEEGEGEGWVDMEDDEEEEETTPTTPISPATPMGPIAWTRPRLEAVRFLSSEDFAMIDRLRAAQAERLSKGGKRKREEEVEDGGEQRVEGAVLPESLVGGRAGRATKAERLMRVLEGRVENRFEHEGHAGGLTNKEKLRKKNYMMVRKGKRSVANKVRKSNSEERYEKMKHKDPYGRDKRKRRRV